MSEQFIPPHKNNDQFNLDKEIANFIESISSKKFNQQNLISLIDKLKENYRDFQKKSGNEYWEMLNERIFLYRLREMKGTLILYSYKFYGHAIIDLYGLLERTMIFILYDLLPTLKGRREVIDYLLNRNHLNNSAYCIKLMGIFNQKDLNKIDSLKKRRDSIAHKNIEKISSLFNRKEISYLDIDSSLKGNDVKSLIIDSFYLLIKLYDGYRNLQNRGFLAQAIIENKLDGKSFEDIYKLFDI